MFSDRRRYDSRIHQSFSQPRCSSSGRCSPDHDPSRPCRRQRSKGGRSRSRSRSSTPIAITSMTPAAGATVSGTVPWQVFAGGSVDHIDFLVDHVRQWTERTAPYMFNGDPSGTLDTRDLTNGAHTLQAVAFDAGGNSTSATSTINVRTVQLLQTVVAFRSSPSGLRRARRSPARWRGSRPRRAVCPPRSRSRSTVRRGGPSTPRRTTTTAIPTALSIPRRWRTVSTLWPRPPTRVAATHRRRR